MGSYKNEKGRWRSLSNCLKRAANNGGNFMSPEIAALVRREIAYREGGTSSTSSVSTAISSPPTPRFNLFDPLKRDLKTATKILRRVFRERVKDVTEILFEHSPGRGATDLFADYTAFDALGSPSTTPR